jgi:hypothetical protein
VYFSTAPHVWGPWTYQGEFHRPGNNHSFSNVILSSYTSLAPNHARFIETDTIKNLDPSGTPIFNLMDLLISN